MTVKVLLQAKRGHPGSRRMGHVGIGNKIEVFKQAGIAVAESPAGLGSTLRKVIT